MSTQPETGPEAAATTAPPPWQSWLLAGIVFGAIFGLIWHLSGKVDRLERQLWAEVSTIEQNVRFDLDEIEAAIAVLRRAAAEEAAREEEEHALEMLRRLQPQLQFALPLPRKETEL